jgi:formate hydrogenlyase subunit 4
MMTFEQTSPFAAGLPTRVLAPLVPGVATRTRAFLTGRRGAPVWQLYADLWKLFRRGIVYSRVTTIPFRLVPIVALAAAVVAALFVPLDGRTSVFAFAGDVVAFAYTLALARFVLVLGALDTGSSFEGMGASREVTFATLVEFALFLGLAAVRVATRQLSRSGMPGAPLADRWTTTAPAIVMVAAGLFVLLLAECSRSPVDDPTTHLELTMIHEVMILDHSGPDLGVILYASAVKMSVLAALLARVAWPVAHLDPVARLGTLALSLVLVGLLVGVVEASMARLKLPKVPLYIAGGAALSALGLVLLLQ